MNRLIDYVDVGGVWAWLALAAGIIGALTVVLALGKRYKQPSAIFAIELGLVAFALGGLGWYLNDRTANERRQMASADAARSAAAAEINATIEADANASVTRPLQVAARAGGAAIVLGGLLFLLGGPTSKNQSRRG